MVQQCQQLHLAGAADKNYNSGPPLKMSIVLRDSLHSPWHLSSQPEGGFVFLLPGAYPTTAGFDVARPAIFKFLIAVPFP